MFDIDKAVFSHISKYQFILEYMCIRAVKLLFSSAIGLTTYSLNVIKCRARWIHEYFSAILKDNSSAEMVQGNSQTSWWEVWKIAL